MKIRYIVKLLDLGTKFFTYYVIFLFDKYTYYVIAPQHLAF